MKIATILGSLNKDGSCAHALKIVQDEILKSNNVDLILIDPADFTLPFPGQLIPKSDEKKLQRILTEAAGIIISTPEYHGGLSSVVKLIIENLGYPSVLSGKPVSLLGVASGSIGAIKSLEQLRSICSHVGALVLPSPVSIANVRSVFDVDGNCKNEKVEQRLKTLATEMIKYAEQHIYPRHAFEEQVRENL
ncbi:FMN-dependent NADPH-azoreductase [bacterium BMS3Abin03]|nr:FMN-dependent NADPH-azoreductase [bacterium BMS3Abin03]